MGFCLLSLKDCIWADILVIWRETNENEIGHSRFDNFFATPDVESDPRLFHGKVLPEFLFRSQVIDFSDPEANWRFVAFWPMFFFEDISYFLEKERFIPERVPLLILCVEGTGKKSSKFDTQFPSRPSLEYRRKVFSFHLVCFSPSLKDPFLGENVSSFLSKMTS